MAEADSFEERNEIFWDTVIPILEDEAQMEGVRRNYITAIKEVLKAEDMEISEEQFKKHMRTKQARDYYMANKHKFSLKREDVPKYLLTEQPVAYNKADPSQPSNSGRGRYEQRIGHGRAIFSKIHDPFHKYSQDKDLVGGGAEPDLNLNKLPPQYQSDYYPPLQIESKRTVGGAFHWGLFEPVGDRYNDPKERAKNPAFSY